MVMNFPDSIPLWMRLHDSAPTIGHFELAVFTAILALILASTALAAENTDPGDTGAQYAWSENTGWLNAEPGGDGGPGILVDDNTLTGYLWSESTGWVSLSCLNNNVCSAREYGVTNDGVGNLAGYAWSENLGWINFSCTSTGSCASGDYGVTIDPATGEFRGRAWNESTGWISFRNEPGATSYGVTTAWPAGEMCAPASDPDLNDDGVVPNPTQLDTDGDNEGDACDSDVDNDGANDDVDAFPTDPTETTDTDGDGLGNNKEAQLGTDPDKADTDGDGYSDKDEVDAGTDPLSADDGPVPSGLNIILIKAAMDAKNP